MHFWWLLALALSCTVLAVPQNHTIDDTSPLVDYYQGLHCSPCPDEFRNYGLDPAQLNNGTFSAFENNGDNGLRLRFNGTAIYVYLAVPAAANLSTPVNCNFILDSVPEAGADFSMISPPEVNQYNVLVYAKTDIPDGSHILNMDVGDTPVVFDYAYYTSDDLEPDPPALSGASSSGGTIAISSLATSGAASTSATVLTSSPTFPLTSGSTSAATMITATAMTSVAAMTSAAAMTSSPAILPSLSTSAAATTSSPTILTSSSPKKTLSIPLIAGAAAVGVALILALFMGFVLYHRARRTKADAPDMEEWDYVPGIGVPRGARDGWVGNGGIQDHHGATRAAQMQQNQSGKGVPLRKLRKQVKRLEGTINGTGSDITSLVSTSTEGSGAEGSESASRAPSLEMMKRDQTRALQDHQRGVGVGVRDMLVHTDSGLRLMAGRVVDEVPPSYVAD
ncbi:hypothetical protein B0H19DRAFT_1133759 [Mycena capillaripes]|nr:hypothetical protein B0H19DRAFT_1133759 [Mycena capillaripes]